MIYKLKSIIAIKTKTTMIKHELIHESFTKLYGTLIQ